MYNKRALERHHIPWLIGPISCDIAMLLLRYPMWRKELAALIARHEQLLDKTQAMFRERMALQAEMATQSELKHLFLSWTYCPWWPTWPCLQLSVSFCKFVQQCISLVA